MNNLYRIFVLLIITIGFLVSCSEEQKEEKVSSVDSTGIIKTEKTKNIDSVKENQTDTISINEKKQQKEVKIYKYICPLGCKKGKSDIKGNCPECGMELIENPDYQIKNSKKQ